MKGATALPWLNTRSPPRITSVTMTGQSQNFFRASMNERISRRVSMASSELILHAGRPWAGGLPLDPVRHRERVELEPQDVVAECAPDPCERRDNTVEDDRHEQERHHHLAHRSKGHPGAVDRAKPGRLDEREQNERPRHHEGPRP